MKIALVVHGRFHAFDLARALISRGHEVTVFTNYPKRVVKRFGVSPEHARSFLLHGVLSRFIHLLSNGGMWWDTSQWFNPMFGRWAARNICDGTPYDVIHAFSGVALEPILTGSCRDTVHLMVRGSCHIRKQDELLLEEERRTNQRIVRPCRAIVEREEQEYALADCIVTLSKFAYDSFLDQGISRDRLVQLPLGVSVEDFRANAEATQARLDRILNGAPIRVLYVGTMSLQKGALDFKSIVNALPGKDYEFRLVGNITADAKRIMTELGGRVQVLPRQPQSELVHQYNWGDVFVFPTIQDGFAAVLAQAAANGLPIIATTNCGAADVVREGKNGWVVPIRTPLAFIDRLSWCRSNRAALAEMVATSVNEYAARTWDHVAAEFEELVTRVRSSTKNGTLSKRLNRPSVHCE